MSPRIAPTMLDGIGVTTDKPQLAAPSSVQAHKEEACYEAKLKGFREGMGNEAPVSNDMMNEWSEECGLPPV